MIISFFNTVVFYIIDKAFPCLQHDTPTAWVGISIGRHKCIGIIG